MSLIPKIVQWYGGKQQIADEIISIMPEHRHYIEVFMGGAAIFFNKSKAPLNTLNDVNGNLTNLFIQVRDHYDELSEKLYWTLYSHKQYKIFYNQYLSGFKEQSDLDRAMAFLFLVRASYASNIQGGCFSAAIGTNSATSFNQSMIEKLKLARHKLDSVIIENCSFIDIFKKYDKPEEKVFFYCDPPYLGTEDFYESEFDWDLHKVLFNFLSKCKSKWLLSYNNAPEIISLYKDFYIQKIDIKYSFGGNSITGALVKNKQELLITNYYPKRPQLHLLDNPKEIDEITDEDKKRIHFQEEQKRIEDERQQAKDKQLSKRAKQNFKQDDLFASGV